MYRLDIYRLSAPFQEVRENLYKHCKVSDETKQSIIEEVTGAMSEGGLVSFITMAAGGLAIMADPVSGSIIIVVSIVYGSVMKAWSGQYFKKYFAKKKQPQNIDADNLEESLIKVLKNSPLIHTGTSKYAFLRILSSTGFTPTLVYSKKMKEKNSSQILPLSTPKANKPTIKSEKSNEPLPKVKDHSLPKRKLKKNLWMTKVQVTPFLEPINVKK